MSYDKEQLKKLSGGGQVRTTYKVPTIKFNGNTGIMTKFPVGDYKNGTEITDVELVIMRARRCFTSFEKSPDGGSVRMYTNEHNTWQDNVTVFEAKTGDKIKVIGNGVIEDLRNELPSLRLNSNCYCLYDGEVHKLAIKGKSRQSFIEKQKDLAKDGVEFFEKNIKLVPKEESGTGGNKYYFLKYEEVSDSDLNVVGPHMEDIAKVMDKMDEEYDAQNKQHATKDVAEDVEEEVLPVINTEDTPEDEIKVEDIPF